MHRRVFALVVGLALSSISPVSLSFAQAPDAPVDQADEDARVLFGEGEAAYSEGRFQEALERFRRAYELSNRVPLLYNIGLAAMNVGNDREALDAFRGYLAGSDDLPNRALVEARIETLERRLEEQAADEQRLRQAEARVSGAPVAGWVLAIAGGVLIAGGGVAFTLGAVDYDDVQSAPQNTEWSSVSGAYERAPLLTGIGIASGGLGAALLVVGLVLVATADSGSVDVAVGPTGVAFGGRL